MPSDPAIPESAIEEKFLAASGPGGQNVNKVATAVQIRLDVFALGLDPEVYRRLKALAGSRWTGEGEIVLTVRTHRMREANRVAARARLAELVAKAHVAPVRRAKTQLNRVGEAKRMTGKTIRAAVKKGRGRVTLD